MEAGEDGGERGEGTQGEQRDEEDWEYGYEGEDLVGGVEGFGLGRVD